MQQVAGNRWDPGPGQLRVEERAGQAQVLTDPDQKPEVPQLGVRSEGERGIDPEGVGAARREIQPEAGPHRTPPPGVHAIRRLARPHTARIKEEGRADIRQVEVLKDLASTSIYGQKGVGGVIVITTRRKNRDNCIFGSSIEAFAGLVEEPIASSVTHEQNNIACIDCCSDRDRLCQRQSTRAELYRRLSARH